MEKLKPCPCCGGEAQIIENYAGQCRIICTNRLQCGIAQDGWFDNPYGDYRYAVKAWNRRVNNEHTD